ncbi:MAG: UDP-N-acetylmuramoyl-L-alanyl-D-glutamate--2,6-diaminopimelate ligase [Christensenellaceae bacterium]|jgi:UDP-N-acetylmuramoyl-L-alanyl-D-glutamate--2,6-diaminopimelate ligase|nr:UDP-N-acetylmuramoyl-L-alanyl-D-glutamate--2,6-diaminopimelate ligase [Christensenellaceae bacterium]
MNLNGVFSLTHNSKNVLRGALFFALIRDRKLRRAHIKEALKNGAVKVISGSGARRKMALIAKKFYFSACDDLKIIAVVGTNGKTTTAHIIKHILKTANPSQRVGIIGTLGIFVDDVKLGEGMTTPDPIELHRAFFEMRGMGVKFVVIEVSAHAIWFEKIAGIKFEVAMLTNITQDHLDFFKTFEVYRETKIGFLKSGQIKNLVINADDPAAEEFDGARLEGGGELNEPTQKRVQNQARRRIKGDNLSFYSGSDAQKLKLSARGSTFSAYGLKISLNLPAKFNVMNALGALRVCRLLGIADKDILTALKTMPSVAGRMNSYNLTAKGGGKFTAVIDYAHTPDGLEKLLTTARELARGDTTDLKTALEIVSGKRNLGGARVICVFGCGGDRDKEKRPIMGKIASELADYIVLTSDNPRFEEPTEIIAQIERGMIDPPRYKIIVDRREAILFMLGEANAGDIVVIAGKGAENYIDIKGVRYPFTDEKIVFDFMNENNYK